MIQRTSHHMLRAQSIDHITVVTPLAIAHMDVKKNVHFSEEGISLSPVLRRQLIIFILPGIAPVQLIALPITRTNHGDTCVHRPLGRKDIGITTLFTTLSELSLSLCVSNMIHVVDALRIAP